MRSREQLRATRLTRKLSRRQVAEATGITESYYGMIEQGVRQPALDVAERIARLFGCTVDAMFCDSSPAPLPDTQKSSADPAGEATPSS